MIYSHSRQPIAPKPPKWWSLSDLNRYLHKKICCMCLLMEQYARFELAIPRWQRDVLPLHQYCIWRRTWDSNPGSLRSPVFKTGAINQTLPILHSECFLRLPKPYQITFKLNNRRQLFYQPWCAI